MKRSEWIEAVVAGTFDNCPLPVKKELFLPAATMAADTLTAAGMKWDPEEEPLPEKLVWRDGITENSASGWWDVAKPHAHSRRMDRNAAILKAALEAYNEVGELRERLQKATEAESPSLDEGRVMAAEILLWGQKYSSLFERAERTRQRADRFQDVVSRAIEYVETSKRVGPTWVSDLLAILKEEKA